MNTPFEKNRFRDPGIFSLTVFVALSLLYLTGCGETIRGMGKDAGRIGSGIHKVFFAD